MNRDLANYFFEQASNAFAFLVTEYLFKPPEFEIDEKINFAFVTFIAANLAVECILDEREDNVTVKIARVIEGRKTHHYAVDEKNHWVRQDLFSLLRRRGIRDRLLSTVGLSDIRKKTPILLQDYAQMLKKYGHEILRDSAAALD